MNWCEIWKSCRRGVAAFFRRLATAVDEPVQESPSMPIRRVGYAVSVSPKKIERLGRRLRHYRDDADVWDGAVRWGERRAVARALDLMRSEYRDYFRFEKYDDGRGGFIIRCTLKVLKDD